MRFSLAFFLVLSLALVSCLGGDDGDGGSNFSIDGSFDVLAIDRAAGTITTRTTFYACEEGESVAEVDTSFDNYAIKDGKLILWEEEECVAQILHGTSTDIVGTWKGTGVEAGEPIPSEYRPSHCPAVVEVDTTGEDFMSDLTVTYQVTETRISFSASGEVCVVEAMTVPMVEDGFTVESGGCNHAVLRDPGGDRMEVAVSLSGSRMSASFQSKGKTCTLASDLAMPGKTIDCKQQQADMEAFLTCVQDMAGAVSSTALRKAAGAIRP
jgi:hypothetical protein